MHDLIKYSIMLHFIWIFTVCQSTYVGVSSKQRVNGCVKDKTNELIKFLKNHTVWKLKYNVDGFATNAC